MREFTMQSLQLQVVVSKVLSPCFSSMHLSSLGARNGAGCGGLCRSELGLHRRRGDQPIWKNVGRSSQGRVVAMSGNAVEQNSQQVSQGVVSSVGTPFVPAALSGFRHWNPADKQLAVMCFTAVMTTGFMATLLAAAIPSLLTQEMNMVQEESGRHLNAKALKNAARAFEKLADAAREELPGTMAAVRLSGMEISDLTMELNDLGQEISKGVRSSARAITAAEAGIRQVGGLASNVWQEQAIVPMQAAQPLVARVARGTRETLVQTRSLLRSLLTLSRLTGWISERFQFSLNGQPPLLSMKPQRRRKF